MKAKKWIFLFGILIGAALLLFYGPVDQFRVLWINTAMNTSNHRYLATALYPDQYIEKVMAESLIVTDKVTNQDPIGTQYSDQILSAEVKGNRYTGQLIKIFNPERLELVEVSDRRGMLLEDIIEEENALGGINASGYETDTYRGETWGYSIVDGSYIGICRTCSERHTVGGLNQNNKLVLGNLTPGEIEEQQYKWAVEFGPILIVNGEKADISFASGGVAPRTAIGQTSEGHILLLAIDGRQTSSIGAMFSDLQEILYENGAINAFALDGGSSTSMVYEGELINSPSDIDSERLVPNAVIFR